MVNSLILTALTSVGSGMNSKMEIPSQRSPDATASLKPASPTIYSMNTYKKRPTVLITMRTALLTNMVRSRCSPKFEDGQQTVLTTMPMVGQMKFPETLPTVLIITTMDRLMSSVNSSPPVNQTFLYRKARSYSSTSTPLPAISTPQCSAALQSSSSNLKQPFEVKRKTNLAPSLPTSHVFGFLKQMPMSSRLCLKNSAHKAIRSMFVSEVK